MRWNQRGRDVAAAVAGLLWAFAFPKWGVAGLAWVAPGLLLFCSAGESWRGRFRRGYISGLVFYVTSLYWLLLIPFPIGAFLGWLALAAYLSLYPAIWAMICGAFLAAKSGERATLPAVSERLRDGGVLRRAGWALVCAAAWVGLELWVSRFLSGFPWNVLGVSQYQVLPLIQISRITGVYGVSFLVVWFSVSLMSSLVLFGTGKRNMRFLWGSDVAAPLLTVVLLVAWGGQLILRPAPAARKLRIALVQPSIPQNLIWDPAQNAMRFKKLVALSQKALEAKPQVLIWPEAALPNMLRFDKETAEAVVDLVTSHHVSMILGSDDAEQRPGSDDPRDIDYYNTAFLMEPDGKLHGVYRKQKLVIFGEYIPLVNWFPFLKRLIPAGEGFMAGSKAVPFHLDELGVTTSVLICFEDVFPEVAREAVFPDADFLLNLTNNGWFGESAAQWQHAANAVFRAVENDIPMVRCANNGLSCWVDPHGGLHDVYFPGTKDIYGAGVKQIEVALGDRSQREPTFYRKHGDLFAWYCLWGLALWSGGQGVRLGRRRWVRNRQR